MISKTVGQTKLSYGNLMLPKDANTAGFVHGGEVMKMMDTAGGIVVRRHCRTNVVTARVDSLEFHSPINVGDYVICECHLTFVGRTSMEVMVKALVEDLEVEKELTVAITGYFTYVAVDSDGRAIPVPPLELETDEERKLYNEGKERYLKYKKSRNNNNV